MSSELFKKYYKRLKSEGIVKAVLCGLIFGFSALALAATLFWFMGWKAFWISLIVWAVVSAVVAVAFYKFKFQPTTKAIARRVDELGLEERIITMMDLEGDPSYIAMRQREDALKALSTVQATLIKLAVSLPVIIGAAISAFAGISMTTVSALSAAGVLKSGLELIDDAKGVERIPLYEVSYSISEGEGFLEGELSQVIEKGGDATAVIAIAEEEWIFIGWSDGLQNPFRQDLNVQSDMEIYAVFLPMDEALDGEEDSEADDQSQEGQPNPDAPKQEIEVPKQDAPAPKYEEINQVIDGNTYYGDVYQDAAENTRNELTEGEYTDDQKGMVGGYLDGIEVIVNEENKK